MTRFVYVLPAGRFRWEVRVDMGDDLDLSHLSAVARAATPGPWMKDPDQPDVVMKPDRPPSTYDGMAICWMQHDDFDLFEEANSDHIATFDPPTVLELLNLIDTEPQFYRRKADALIAARAIAILVGGEVQPHDRRGRIQDPDSHGNDPRESAG